MLNKKLSSSVVLDGAALATRTVSGDIIACHGWDWNTIGL